jgi:hypothetical protein
MNPRRPVSATTPTDAVTAPGQAAHQTPPVPREVPLVLDRATIACALADGTATPLTPHVTSLVHHRGVWWLDDDDAWLQITDHTFAATLHTIHDEQSEPPRGDRTCR